MRLLSNEESRILWVRLEEKWDIKPYYYWFPLTEQEFDNNAALALDAEQFEKEFGYERLIKILKKTGISKVIELSENGYGEKDAEIDLDEFEPVYSGAEGFWCTQDLDWIIYASHEVSITFAGPWLVEEIRRNYPMWQDRLWINKIFDYMN